MAEYDVFISFKNTDKNGNQTIDSKMAEDLYHALKKKGIKAFYSNISIEEKGESGFRQLIDIALEQCCIFVAVGTSAEHLTSNNVSDEIYTFRDEMLNGHKPLDKSALVSYISNDLSSYELPLALRKYQSFNDIEKLIIFIENRLKSNSLTDTGVDKKEEISFADCTLKKGEIIAGKYEIIKPIGKGGLSTVYLVKDIRLCKTWALKHIENSRDSNMSMVYEHLATEANLLKRLFHTNIVTIVDIWNLNNDIFILMQYVEGDSLDKVIETKGQLTQKKVVEYAKQLCDVLTYLHSQNPAIIYRDLKPANIILQPDGKIKLIDFGSARDYKPGNLADTVCLGTKGYAAPEQYGGKGQSDARTDIYCLGATLYHLATGKSPSEPPYEFQPIHKINPNFSDEFNYIVQKCTQPNPDKRFQSADDLMHALNKLDIFTKIVEPTKTAPRPVKTYEETTLLDKSVRQASANDFVKASNQQMFVDAVAQVRLCVCSYQIDDEEIISAFIFSNNNKQQLLERLKKLSAKLLIKPSKPFVVRPYDVLTLTTNGSHYCEFCWTGSVCETTICEPFRTIGIYHYSKKLAKISLES